jgi:hypothetical protein
VRVANRVLKLERTVSVSGLPVIQRLQRALDQAAFRISGTALVAASLDDPALDRILDDVQHSFIRQAVSLTGTMTFDGSGNYSFTGQLMKLMDSQSDPIITNAPNAKWARRGWQFWQCIPGLCALREDSSSSFLPKPGTSSALNEVPPYVGGGELNAAVPTARHSRTRRSPAQIELWGPLPLRFADRWSQRFYRNLGRRRH